MKLLKMLGLAASAAAVVMAFGASAASAAAGDIDSCLYTSGNPALTEAGCKSVGGTIDTKSTKGKYVAKALNPTLKGTLSEKCNESNTTTETKGDGTNGFLVTALSFTGSCTPCTEVETFVPYSGEITMVGTEYFLQSTGGARLKGCPFGVNCKFGSKNITLKLVYGAAHLGNEFRAAEEPLTLEEGSKLLCGSTGTWTANYEVSSPEKFFFFLL